ncbi:S9 family peptidase [candidate division KSB1 bacterium]|nr:S9 family peptidase [candidate division KSB1 bacterium]
MISINTKYRMKMFTLIRHFVLVTILFTLPYSSIFAQSVTVSSTNRGMVQTEMPLSPVEAEDYGKWEQLSAGVLSPYGKWIAYQIRRVNEENELRVHNLEKRTLTVYPYGAGAVFSDDGTWMAYTISHSEQERKKLESQKKPVRNKLGIINLDTGDKSIIDNIASFSFSGDGAYIVMKSYKPEGAAGDGVNIILRDLSTGVDMGFGNISEYAWQEAGTILAMIIDAEGKTGNGVRIYDPSDNRIRTLVSESTRFTGLQWREKEDDLAVLQEIEDELYEDPTHKVLAWSNLAGDTQSMVFNPAEVSNFPGDTRVVSSRNLAWSDDGMSIFFGTQDWVRKPGKSDDSDDETDDEETANVEIWHSKDVNVIPEQKLRAERFRNRNFLAVWHMENNKIIQLGDELTENVSLIEGDIHAVGTDDTPYEFSGMFGRSYVDMYIIDVASGDKTKIKEKIQYNFGSSPGGKYLLYLEKDDFWTYNIQTKTHTNITSKIRTSFINKEYDHPVEQKPAFGRAGWTEDDNAVLLYDKYDIWQVPMDGNKATNLTNGEKDKIRHRYVSLDRDEEFIDILKPYYVSTYGEWSKNSGYSVVTGGDDVSSLVWQDNNVGRLIKAEKAEVFAYVAQDFDDSPDYFTVTGDWAETRQVSETNPFQKDYAWGRSELIEYKNSQGRNLQGALYYPAGYEEGKSYPMIVYIYEFLSQNVHRYVTPSERSTYNTSVFTSKGYFVLQPDIVFKIRAPGRSSISTIESAVKKVLKTGMIDPERLGLMGHSWGGYQTAFGVTQTDIFAAGVAGAPLTNFFSMYGSVFWNSGVPETGHFETGQERMDVPFWEDVDAYIKNSPVFSVENLNTPLLMEFGDKDGSVDWHQGLEYYNAARRAGKDLVMLVYPGENHSVRKKANQIDYHHRILEWFGHYLNGEPAPKWISEGLSYVDQQKANKNGG